MMTRHSSFHLLFPLVLPLDSSFTRPSCCTDPAAAALGSIRNQKLGTFTRVARGDSFRIPEIRRRGEVAVAAAASSMMPPARILDLRVEVLTDSRRLEFSWTAPGEDFDQGKEAEAFFGSLGHPLLGC